MGEALAGALLQHAEKQQLAVALQCLPNESAGVTAFVTRLAAVNASSKRTEDCAALVTALLEESAQSQAQSAAYLSAAQSGIPVQQNAAGAFFGKHFSQATVWSMASCLHQISDGALYRNDVNNLFVPYYQGNATYDEVVA